MRSTSPSSGPAPVRTSTGGLLSRRHALRGGGVGYDIMDWSADQVAHDVLDHYERWLEYLGTSGAARETGGSDTRSRWKWHARPAENAYPADDSEQFRR
mgnify:CR=1 FL=1